MVPQDTRSSFLDPASALFKQTMYQLSALLFVAIVAGVLYHYCYYIRMQRARAATIGKSLVCARLAQLVRSLTANQEVSGSIPGLVEG